MTTMESDEALARRLQAQELGVLNLPERMDAQTPLMVGSVIAWVMIGFDIFLYCCTERSCWYTAAWCCEQ